MPVAPTLGRIGRFLHSIFAPATAIFGFSCLLTFIFVLYQPHPGPGAIQQVGWQSWEIVSSESSTGVGLTHTKPPPEYDTEDDATDVNVPPSGDIPSDTDWWDISTPESATPFDPVSLPLDVWDPLMQHDTGCTLRIVIPIRSSW